MIELTLTSPLYTGAKPGPGQAAVLQTGNAVPVFGMKKRQGRGEEGLIEDGEKEEEKRRRRSL